MLAVHETVLPVVADESQLAVRTRVGELMMTVKSWMDVETRFASVALTVIWYVPLTE